MQVKTGYSEAPRARDVAQELAQATHSSQAKAALVFASPVYDADELAAELETAFAPTAVYGCTTAGEIGSKGFSGNSCVAMTLSSSDLRIGAGVSQEISRSPLVSGGEAALAATTQLGLTPATLTPARHVAVCLIDGQSRQEESFVAGAAEQIPAVPLVGGSASDLGAQRAAIFFEGKALRDAGLILMFETSAPFSVVMCEHMTPTENRVVVTASDPSQRLVYEFNGRPAREVMGELLGEPATRTSVAMNPLALYVKDRAYVRSMMDVEGDAIRFACAVETGVVLRVVKPGDIIKVTRDALLAAARDVGGTVAGAITFNCLGRFYETEAAQSTAEMGQLLASYGSVGFNTFGEQVNALHVNHTLTALVFGLRGG